MMSRAQSSVSANYTVMCQSGPRRKYQGKLTLIKVGIIIDNHGQLSCSSSPSISSHHHHHHGFTVLKEFSEDGAGPAYKWLPTQVFINLVKIPSLLNFQVEDLKLAGVNVKPRQWHDLVIPLHDLVATMPGLEVEAADICLTEHHYHPLHYYCLLHLDQLTIHHDTITKVEAAGTCLADRGTNLFRGNLGQSAVLENEGKAAQWDPCPLVT